MTLTHNHSLWNVEQARLARLHVCQIKIRRACEHDRVCDPVI